MVKFSLIAFSLIFSFLSFSQQMSSSELLKVMSQESNYDKKVLARERELQYARELQLLRKEREIAEREREIAEKERELNGLPPLKDRVFMCSNAPIMHSRIDCSRLKNSCTTEIRYANNQQHGLELNYKHCNVCFKVD